LEAKFKKIYSQEIEMGENLKGENELSKTNIENKRKYRKNVNESPETLKLER